MILKDFQARTQENDLKRNEGKAILESDGRTEKMSRAVDVTGNQVLTEGDRRLYK